MPWRTRVGRALRLLPAVVLVAWHPAVAQGVGSATATAGVADTSDALTRALAAEDRNDRRGAAVAYRDALQRALVVGNTDGDRVAIALLGLERVWAELAQLDSLLPVVQRVLQLRPTDPTARSVQLRSLVTMARDDEARVAFDAWRRVAGQDATPYREYARLLLQQGRSLAADSLLTDAERRLGGGGALAGETAQLHVSLGRWTAAARAFRQAFADEPWLETSAVFGLSRTPAASRDSVRAVLEARPVAVPVRRLLAALELAWGDPRRAWGALRSLPMADDSTVAAWKAFAERVEINESWLVARDAWQAVLGARATDVEAFMRGADAALRAGDAAGALTILRDRRPARGAGVGDSLTRSLLALEIAVLGELGRADEAQRLLEREGPRLDSLARADLSRPLVAAWLRRGDVARARAAMAGTELAEDDEMVGWLALYDGNLGVARRRLVRASTRRPELVDALGLLARVRLDQSLPLGQAFLMLARRDSAAAAAKFIQAADSVGPAAPALLALASRLSVAAAAASLWSRIIREYPRSPEAPEALLAWGRALRDAGDRDAAIARYEQLLLEYPASALAPQARRDLERLRGLVPPAGR